jgi:hypothetical protein
MAQPRPPERKERYLAIPCSGSNLPAEENHLYKILDYEHSSRRITFRGWVPRERAIERFGISNIYFSESHGLCPGCNKYLDEILDQD